MLPPDSLISGLAGIDRPWNKYHELNVDFCGDSKNSALILHGRGKPGSFHFPGKSPSAICRSSADVKVRHKRGLSTTEATAKTPRGATIPSCILSNQFKR
jgi:hypothetical protein